MDVLLEVDVPFWICPEDVTVRIMPDRLHVSVRNELSLCRTYWHNRRDPHEPLDSPLHGSARCRQGRHASSCIPHAHMYRQEEGRGGTWEAVDLEESMWSLDSSEDAQGEVIKTLMISLVKPPLTETEVNWKRGAVGGSGRACCVPGRMSYAWYDCSTCSR